MKLATGRRTLARARAALAMGVAMLGLATSAGAHEDPPGCNQTGPQLILGVFFADGVTPVQGPLTQCETIVYRVTLSKPNDPTVCAFQGGTLTVTTPNGVIHNLTPGGGIPCLGGTSGGCNPAEPPVTGSVQYTVSPGNVIAGTVTATANYTGGVAHDFEPNTPGVSATTPKTNPVVFCADNLVCNGTETCNPNQLFGPGNVRRGACVPGTPLTCPGDECNTGSCVEPGGCQTTPKPDGFPCTDTDGQTCTTAGCVAGVCNQTYQDTCPVCGNGRIDVGETCDPPDPTPVPDRPGQVVCRPDCTYCGDSIVQPQDGESCDDGNLTSGCDPNKPTIPVDACQNNCTPPICADPARIRLRPTGDNINVHGRIRPIAPATTIDPTDKTFTLLLTRAGGTVYETTIPAGAIVQRGKVFKYKNSAAKTTGGIKKFTMVIKKTDYLFKLQAYGDFDSAEAEMVTHVKFGADDYSAIGTWTRLTFGWRLNFDDVYYHP